MQEKTIFKDGRQLFQIGRVTELIKVTRKMILNYEDHGLIEPAYKDPDTGYRYYTADNISHIQLIRAFQNFGMSLSEIKDYFNGDASLANTIRRLEELREEINTNISRLQVHDDSSYNNEFFWTILPRQRSYFKRANTYSIETRTNDLRDAYLDVVHNYKLGRGYLFNEILINDKDDCIMYIPVDEECTGDNIIEMPEVRAICFCYKGSYEEIGTAIQSLIKFIVSKGIQPLGKIRNIFLEGPPSRGQDKKSYITKIAIPVKDIYEEIPRR